MSRFSIISDPMAQPFSYEGGPTGVLLLHGFTASPGQMRPLGGALRDAGYTVEAIRLPGHGTTVEDMERATAEQWLSASETACEGLLRRCGKVFVMGLSMGGALTLHLAEHYPLSGAVPMAAAIRMRNPFLHLWPLVWPFHRYDVSDGPKDPEQALDVGYCAAPVKKVGDLFRIAKLARRNLERITCPLLIVQPRLDDSVKVEAAEEIRRGAVNAAEREVLYLERSRHVCTIAPEFDLLSGRILDFLSRHG